MLVIFAASSIPSTAMPRFDVWDTMVKKGGHMLGYALLAMSYAHGWAHTKRRPLRRAEVLGVWLAVVLYAISDELHQRFVPGRGASPIDVGIDGIGALIGLAIWLKFFSK